MLYSILTLKFVNLYTIFLIPRTTLPGSLENPKKREVLRYATVTKNAAVRSCKLNNYALRTAVGFRSSIGLQLKTDFKKALRTVAIRISKQL